MKANAPEKIYIHPDIGGREFLRPWLRRAANNESVEYTRTDAFIERAEKYLTEKFIKDVSVLAGGVASINFDAAISNFINYMKGE